MRVPSIIGLDLSLRCAAAVSLPIDWNPGSWRTIDTMTIGQNLPKDASAFDAAMRLVEICRAISRFVEKRAVKAIYVEDYAYGLSGQGRKMRIGELGGAIKMTLLKDYDLVVTPVNVMTARKYLLGKLPRANQAAAAMDGLKAMGAKFATSDEADAFVIANYGLSEQGQPGLSIEA